MEIEKKKILIVEDHPVVIKGLSQVINKQEDLSVCGVASSANKALKLIRDLSPDMITVDITLKNSSGLELIKNLTAEFPKMPILVISMYDENIYAERTVKAGAKGYIMKEKLTKELIKAIRKVLSGKIYLSENMQNIFVDKSIKGNTDQTKSAVDLLSDRELEVFDMIGQGLTTNEISKKLNLGIKTVETYKGKIKEKLNIENSTKLVKFAVEWRMTNK
jgi:DNA-binding NarL/FixJ family response regulator